MMEQNNKKLILCFGDSLTSGFLDPYGVESNPYAKELGKLLGSSYEIVEAGYPGEGTETMKERLQSFTPKLIYPPSYTILLGGTNDLVDEEGEEILTNLKEMTEYSLTIPNNHVILLSIPHHGWEKISPKTKQNREHVDEGLRKLAKERPERVSYVDIFSHLPKEKEELWGSSGLHLTPKGYDLVGKVIYDTVFAGK